MRSKKQRAPRVGFVSLGCPKAASDAELILTRLRAEGYEISGSYDGADLASCESLYASGRVEAPVYAYHHTATVVPGEACPTGSSSIAGLAFYETGSYPSTYEGALLFTDYNRRCLWAMLPGAAGVPDPDLLIRTSGEKRISNFLLWQSAYTELVFVDTRWPDFNEADLADAVREYHRRERRYGATGA